MELWDIYDKNRIKTGRTIARGQKLQKGDYHLVIHLCIFNKKGELLIQQRQPWKGDWPNMWDLTVGGCAVAGETSAQAAEREVMEEIGLTLDLSDERPFFTMNFENGFDDYYLLERKIDIAALTLQQEEVQAVQWADRAQVASMVREGRFINYWFLNLLFERRTQRGAIRAVR